LKEKRKKGKNWRKTYSNWRCFPMSQSAAKPAEKKEEKKEKKKKK